MSLTDIADYISRNESDFLNEFGFFERWYIRDRFDMSQEDYKELMRLLNE